MLRTGEAERKLEGEARGNVLYTKLNQTVLWCGTWKGLIGSRDSRKDDSAHKVTTARAAGNELDWETVIDSRMKQCFVCDPVCDI